MSVGLWARARRRAGFVGVALLVAASAAAQPFAGGTQMPDPRQMSGVPLPMGDLAVGTVTVRVARGAVTNPLTGVGVELTGAGTQTATTDAQGRATFTGLPPGTRVKASATVDGEKLESQAFDVPASGGVRLALIATDPELTKKAEEDRKLAASPAVDGVVVLGEQSRIVVELGDDGLNVFNILQILNTARRPVKVASPLTFDVPAEAIGLGLLEGAPKDALASGHRVTVSGPFAPGTTLLQFGYTLPFVSSAMTVRQTMPTPMTGLSVAVQTDGGMRLSSPQLAQQRTMSAQGQSFIVAQGPAIPAGGPISLEITGLPHSPVWPRNLALGLASVVLLGGAWAAMRSKAPEERPSRARNDAERERLFSTLLALDEKHRRGELDERRYAEEREDLVSALSRVYGTTAGENVH